MYKPHFYLNRRESHLLLELLEPRMLMTVSSGAGFSNALAAADLFSDSLAFPAHDTFVANAGDTRIAGTNGLKRYAILGDDLSGAEAALAELGRAKIKNFQHFSGLAVQVSDAEAESLKARLGNEVRVVKDESIPFLADANVERGKSVEAVAGKPGGGGGNPGGGQQVPWGITAVNAPAAWSVTRGAGVAVCVTDTGLDMDHPDLAANIAGGANYINGGSWDDDNGHGTHVGGTIAALDNSIGVVGVAPQATLLAAKFLDRRGNGTNTDAAEAIYGCKDLRDTFVPGIPLVVNMSWTGADELIHTAINDLAAQGVIFVGAVSNNSIGAMSTPGKWPEVLCITGVNQDLSFWSNSGWNSSNDPSSPFYGQPYPYYRDPDFTAPAVNVLSLWKGGGTKSADGTSMATAHVSGVVALGLAAGTLQPLNRDPYMFEYWSIRETTVYEPVPLEVPLGRDIGLIPEKQGLGFIDALLTVQAQVPQAVSVAVAQASALSVIGQSSDVVGVTSDAKGFVGASASSAVSRTEYGNQLTDKNPEVSSASPQITVQSVSTSHRFSGNASLQAVDLVMADFGKPGIDKNIMLLAQALDTPFDAGFAAT